jgi:hypothetical protein
MTNPYFYASGARPDDPNRALLFFDGFTSERSRTIEPSTVDGGRYYEIFASCMRVYRLQVREDSMRLERLLFDPQVWVNRVCVACTTQGAHLSGGSSTCNVSSLRAVAVVGPRLERKHSVPMRPLSNQTLLGIVSDGVSCDVAGEECCELTADEVGGQRYRD